MMQGKSTLGSDRLIRGYVGEKPKAGKRRTLGDFGRNKNGENRGVRG